MLIAIQYPKKTITNKPSDPSPRALANMVVINATKTAVKGLLRDSHRGQCLFCLFMVPLFL